MVFDPAIYVVDAGSVSGGKFHWVCSRDFPNSSKDSNLLADQIVQDLKDGRSVAIGYESPLFIPCRHNACELGQARSGECTKETGNRPWSAAAGAAVLATGIQSLAWLLREIKTACPDASATTDWHSFVRRETKLLVWEAFVSGSEKACPPSHEGDARLAMESFRFGLTKPEGPKSAIDENTVFSLAGAAILFAGLSSDNSLLHGSTLVVRPIPKSLG